MVQFGPGDYSLSLGYPGQCNHPKVKEAELKTIETAIKKPSPGGDGFHRLQDRRPTKIC